MNEASERLLWACKSGDVEQAKLAIENGANVCVQDLDSYHPLRFAAGKSWNYNISLVKMLVDAGADVNQQGCDKWTAMHGEPSPEILEILLAAGGNPNIVNDFRSTPMHHAGNKKSFRLLIDFGADLRLKNLHGHTPFQYLLLREPDIAEENRSIFEDWTPHRMLPRWNRQLFSKYIEECDGFRDAIQTLLLCFLRYRHLIAKQIGMQIIDYVAEMHRQEMWWPSWENFEMSKYM